MIGTRKLILARAAVVALSVMAFFSVSTATPNAPKNSWRGITPLRSSAADVAQLLGVEPDAPDAPASGPLQVEGGEVTISYLTPSLAKLYKAPRQMVGKVFTIYFKPNQPAVRSELKLTPDFKQCVAEFSRRQYFMVSASGLAYQFARDGHEVQMVIYQPSRAEIQRLAVNAECVF